MALSLSIYIYTHVYVTTIIPGVLVYEVMQGFYHPQYEATPSSHNAWYVTSLDSDHQVQQTPKGWNFQLFGVYCCKHVFYRPKVHSCRSLEGRSTGMDAWRSFSKISCLVRGPRDHIKTRILEIMISGIPLLLGLGTRM